MNKKVRSAEQKRKSYVSPRIVLAGVILLLSVLLLIIIAVQKKQQQENPAEMEEANTAADTNGVLPEMHADSNNENGYFLIDEMDENLIDYVSEKDSYQRQIRVVQSYEGKSSSVYYTITRSEQSFRIESDNLLIISDGTDVYKNYGTAIQRQKADTFSYYEDIGLTSLNDIREMIRDKENFESTVDISADKRRITVIVKDSSRDLLMEFEIALESGLVTKERFYHDGVFYRNVVTESVLLTAQTSSETFLIPQNNNE